MLPNRNYIHMYVNEKMIPVETILGMGERGKGEQWRG
jgi:hypothetical protein